MLESLVSCYKRNYYEHGAVYTTVVLNFCHSNLERGVEAAPMLLVPNGS